MGTSGFSWKLEDHPKLEKGKVIALIVLDGWGEANPDQYNCIHVAETPVMDSLKTVLFLSTYVYVCVYMYAPCVINSYGASPCVPALIGLPACGWRD